jgi:hypothetical protein
VVTEDCTRTGHLNDAGTQIKALAVSFGIAVAGGLVTGFIMKSTAAFTIGVPGLQFFNDRMFWAVPSDYEVVAK